MTESMLFFIALIGGGFLVTALAVVGVVLVARRYKNQDGAGKVMMILAMLGLAMFALVGVGAMGCGALTIATASYHP
ncbi:MAG: hypothetical protein U0441_11935 [Polyangiaceae bacterium]